MKKKLGSLLLAGTLCVSLLFSACTGGGATPATDPGTSGGGDTPQ